MPLLLVGCQALPSSEPAFPLVLYVDGRGNPPIDLKVGAVQIARFGCGIGTTLKPGNSGIPQLPWSLSVVDVSDGKVLLTSSVNELPRWLTIYGDQAGIGSVAPAGPPGPTCSPQATSSAAPLITPSPSPTPPASPGAPTLPSGLPTFTLVLPLDANHEEQVVLYDSAGLLAGARGATAREQQFVAPEILGLDAGLAQGIAGRDVVIVWIGTICDRDASVIIEGSLVTIIEGPRPACDAMAVGRGVTLEYAGLTKASSLTVEYFTARIVQ